MVAVLLTAVAIMPVFGAVTGTVALDKTFVAPDAGEGTNTVKITVTDADLNTTTAYATQTFTTSGTGQAGVSQTFTLTGVTGTDKLVTSSLRDDNTSYFTTAGFQDVGTSFINIIPAAAEAAAVAIAVGYQKSIVDLNDTLVSVSSPLSTGFTVSMTETAAGTGIFEGTFVVSATSTLDFQLGVSKKRIHALPGMDVSVSYSDGDPAGKRVTTVRVEDTAPAGILKAPTTGSTTTTQTPTFSVDFTDTDSGLLAGGIQTTTWITSASSSSDGGLTENAVTLTLDTITTTAITNGFNASRKVTAGVADGVTTRIEWQLTATDKAGNVGTSDADGGTTGNQPYVLVIDRQKPDFANAAVRVGAWWDAVAGKVVNGKNGEEDKASNTSIGIKLGNVFDAIPESLNAGTVSVGDFDIDSLKQVNGVTLSDLAPTAVLVPASATNWIFLTVPAMSPDAKPTISLKTTAGGISDTAGNAQDTGVNTKATDEIAPTLTASLDKNLDKTKATISITTNETITGTPTVTWSKVNGVAGSSTGVVVTTTGVNQWNAVVTPATDGAYALKVEVQDSSTNKVSIGNASPAADGTDRLGALALHIDSNLAAPTLTPANTTSKEISEPFFITVNFAAEATDLNGVTATNDAHKKVTITAITLDGADISALLDPQGESTSFDIAKTGITTGLHTLVVEAKDSAGNELATASRTSTFTVTARKAYKVAVNAGWNLISFPGTPKDGAIAAVFPTTHPSTEVLAYDDGVWKGAFRSAGGAWAGELTTIDGFHGYWVNTSSSAAVEALLALPSVGSAATLPTIAIESGWNLISVIDLAQVAQGTADGADADSLDEDVQEGKDYLTSVSWSVAYTYSSSTRQWTRVTPSAGTLGNGQGVWVWATKAGTLIP